MPRRTVGLFLTNLKEEKLLINGALERAIREQTRQRKWLNTSQQNIVRKALGEMNRREIGVYIAASVIISVINAFLDIPES